MTDIVPNWKKGRNKRVKEAAVVCQHPTPAVSTCTHRLKSDKQCVYRNSHTRIQAHACTISHQNGMFPNTQTPMFNRPEIFDRCNDLIDQKHQPKKTTQLETRIQKAHSKQ